MKNALGQLSDMSDASFGRLVTSEALVIRTNNLAITLKKVAANDVKGLAMEEGFTKFKLPANLGDIGGGDINAKVWIVAVFNAFARHFRPCSQSRVSPCNIMTLFLDCFLQPSN